VSVRATVRAKCFPRTENGAAFPRADCFPNQENSGAIWQSMNPRVSL
jgi:hypothetical protein